jgi:hypothetical protein
MTPTVTKPFILSGATALVRRARRFPGYARPRRFQLFGVGLGKTGSTSIARIFGRYRASHELDWARLLPLGARWYGGEASAAEVRRELRRRDWRFRLEVDSALFLVPFVDVLADLHPRAKFVLTIRDCFSWLSSRVDYDAARPAWREDPRACTFALLYTAQFDRYGERFRPEEAALVESGLRYPIAAELRFWAEANERMISVIPNDRLLVVRTEDLDSSVGELARFAGVQVASLLPVHANENPNRARLVERLPRGFVGDLAREYCGTVMERYWGPDWISVQERR